MKDYDGRAKVRMVIEFKLFNIPIWCSGSAHLALNQEVIGQHDRWVPNEAKWPDTIDKSSVLGGCPRKEPSKEQDTAAEYLLGECTPARFTVNLIQKPFIWEVSSVGRAIVGKYV